MSKSRAEREGSTIPSHRFELRNLAGSQVLTENPSENSFKIHATLQIAEGSKGLRDYIADGASSSTKEDSMSATGKYRKMSNIYFTNIQENCFPLFMFLKSGTVDIQLLSLLSQVDSSKSS